MERVSEGSKACTAMEAKKNMQQQQDQGLLHESLDDDPKQNQPTEKVTRRPLLVKRELSFKHKL